MATRSAEYRPQHDPSVVFPEGYGVARLKDVKRGSTVIAEVKNRPVPHNRFGVKIIERKGTGVAVEMLEDTTPRRPRRTVLSGNSWAYASRDSIIDLEPEPIY